jgi:hypothetical protein
VLAHGNKTLKTVKIMRTKTVLLSTLLGALGSVSVMAQNVYSLNAVGYINVSIPPGWSILTCPLITSPDNTLNTLLPNTSNQYGGPAANGNPAFHTEVYAFSGGVYTLIESAVSTAANASGWSQGGADISLTPGSAVFIYNPLATAETATWVGTVPSGSQTNVLIPGWNLVGSIVPASGDIVTNSITDFTGANKQDNVYTYDPVAQNFDIFSYTPALGGWTSSGVRTDPATTNVTQGFFYYNTTTFQTATNYWVENFTP